MEWNPYSKTDKLLEQLISIIERLDMRLASIDEKLDKLNISIKMLQVVEEKKNRGERENPLTKYN
ncbi:hypothetical protein [Caloramator sp. Dgby_cultured_2]|uniref:hypothetical protein n=1 Tax=Caloramator sp. Dgby_cultured_2 TaxID=3029174 RepID=UPI00237D7F31|nr:hypothetical protein [Caloramator sp. Dgby_cultured_2]WDU82815.1 hypothetical protein PWK10_15105 [Caloramator sp. Dgby_cultured_2]